MQYGPLILTAFPDIAIFYTQDNTDWHQLDLPLKSGGYSTRGEEGWRYVDWDTERYIDEDDGVWVRVTAVDDPGASSDDTDDRSSSITLLHTTGETSP